MPSFNEKGEMTGLRMGPIDSVITSVTRMLKEGSIDRKRVISFVTSNPADHLKLPKKGRLRPGYDGDVLVFDGEYRLRSVAAKGRLLMEDGEVIVKGTFE